MKVLQIGALLQAVSAGGAWLVCFVAADGLWPTMSVFYALVFSQTVLGAPLMAIFLEPFQQLAGLASGIQACVQTFAMSALAFTSTEMSLRYGAAGLLSSLGAILSASQLAFWLLVGLWVWLPARGAATRRDAPETSSAEPE